MTEIDRFLEPIPGENPAGHNLKYTLHDQIKEARRFESAGPMGHWEREIKEADYKKVVRLGEEALVRGSKDLWIAAWLTDAWIYDYGIPGLTSGLQLLCGLLERFWHSLYPPLEDGDAEERAVPLDWNGTYFEPGKTSSPITAVHRVALSQSGHDWFSYAESRRVGYENEARGGDAKTKREAAIKEHKLTPEAFDKDFEATPEQFYSDLERDVAVALQALAALDAICTHRFGDAGPSYTPLRTTLVEFANVVHILHLKKPKTEPPPVPESSPAKPREKPAEEKGHSKPEAAIAPALLDGEIPHLPELNGEIVSLEQAASHVIAAAQFMQQATPSNPVSYLLLRALRWGEMRSAGAKALANLPAPPSGTRVALRAAADKKQWNSVLHTAETAMSTIAGRGWLDLQRYSIKACEELGYSDAAKALRSELKAYLQDFPQLSSAILSDDTGAANPETLAWLRQEGFLS